MTNRRHFFKTTALGAAALSLPKNAQAAAEEIKQANPRFKLSLAAYSFHDQLHDYRRSEAPAEPEMDMASFLDYCATLHLEAAELTSYFLPQDCSRELALELKNQAHRLGLDISGGAIGNNFAYAPGSPELKKQMAYTEHWIKTYAIMGAPVIRTFAGKPKDKKISKEQAEKNIIANLKTAIEIAAHHGVILGLENHDFTTDIDRLERILDAIDSPWFGLNFDSGNLAKTSDPYGDLKRIAPHTVNAQLKIDIPRDGKKEPADFKRIVNILAEANYKGYLVLEYEAEAPKKEIPGYLAKLRATT